MGRHWWALSAFVAMLLAVAPVHLGGPPPSPAVPPVEFLQAALARHRIVFLGDIHPIAEPKELVARLIAGQQGGATIDLLALEVGADEQEAIDRYLASTPEDTTILLEQPRTLRAHWGASAEYLDIYRAVYRWNARHPDRPVHIFAADIRGWPMAPLTERMGTGAFANRDLWMAAGFRKKLQEHPEWRALVFMGGYHGLKSGGGEVMIGRARDRFDNWFAGYLVQEGLDVYTVLTDARQANGRGATRVFDLMAEAHPKGNFVVALDQSTDVIAEPIYNVEEQGYHLEFWPSRFPIRQAADAMLVLNDTRPITILHGER
jgi:hypothetical protein